MKILKVSLVKFILFFTFLANAFLGYPWTNVLIGFIPLNEVLLVFALLVINKDILKVIKKYPIVLLLLIWSLSYMILSVPFGFSKYGIWAGRDATHLIEVWWIVVALYLYDRVDVKNELKKALKLIFIFFIIKFIIILGGDNLKGIFVIHGVQGDIDIFGNRTGINLVIFIVLFSWFMGLYKSIFTLLFSLVFIAILQARTIYIGIISFLILYIFIYKFSFKKLLKIFSGFIILIFLMYVISYMSFLNEYTRFGIEAIRPHNILLHLLASTGSSEEYAASAHGTVQRIAWFLINWQRAMEDEFVFWFGQGFGVVLTDFATTNIVREPHNSYLSVFARTGMVGLILWISFHIIINTKAFLLLRRYHKIIKYSINLKYLFVTFFTMQAMYWFSLVEPGFESPQTCINFYILLGLMLYLIKKVENVKNICK